MSAFKDITGQRFGQLTVLRREGSTPHKHTTWLCRCDCGVEKVITKPSLVSGHSTSCGCLQKRIMRDMNLSHGLSKHDTYKIWKAMRTRCTNPNSHNYHNYGGRGISVDPSWNSFEVFFKDMGPRPSKSHSIDRIDNEKGYSKDNCRWATQVEQCNNSRNCRIITYNGISKNLTQWEKHLGFSRGVIKGRLSRGWSPEEAVSIPLGEPRQTR